jgi:hypothetical protein
MKLRLNPRSFTFRPIRDSFLTQTCNLLKEKNLFKILGTLKNVKELKIEKPKQILLNALKGLGLPVQLKHQIKSGRVVYSIQPRRLYSRNYQAINFLKTSTDAIKITFFKKISNELALIVGKENSSIQPHKISYQKQLLDARLNLKIKYRPYFKKFYTRKIIYPRQIRKLLSFENAFMNLPKLIIKKLK